MPALLRYLGSIRLSPNQHAEVRFFVPLSDAMANRLQAERVQSQFKPTLKPLALASIPEDFNNSDASVSLEIIILTNLCGANLGGVAVNSASGEVLSLIIE